MSVKEKERELEYASIDGKKLQAHVSLIHSLPCEVRQGLEATRLMDCQLRQHLAVELDVALENQDAGNVKGSPSRVC